MTDSFTDPLYDLAFDLWRNENPDEWDRMLGKPSRVWDPTKETMDDYLRRVGDAQAKEAA